MNKRILVYAGAHLGGSLSQHLNNFDVIFAFEANPWFCEQLSNRFSQHSNLHVVNAALCNVHKQKVVFNISRNNGDSSSLLMPNKENSMHDGIRPSAQVLVEGVNLGMFLAEKGIDRIDTYISDLQGYDYEVLKTLKPLIDRGAINSIECEVEKTDKPPIYVVEGIERNIEENFNTILEKNYQKVATGWGRLTDGVFANVPDNWSEWDIKWKLKAS